MAKTVNEQTNTAEETEQRKITEADVQLPDYFDKGKAASIVGMKDAISFRDEVLMITSGDLSQHGDNPGVNLKGMIDDAADETISSRTAIQDALKRVRQTFAERINNSQKTS